MRTCASRRSGKGRRRPARSPLLPRTLRHQPVWGTAAAAPPPAHPLSDTHGGGGTPPAGRRAASHPCHRRRRQGHATHRFMKEAPQAAWQQRRGGRQRVGPWRRTTPPSGLQHPPAGQPPATSRRSCHGPPVSDRQSPSAAGCHCCRRRVGAWRIMPPSPRSSVAAPAMAGEGAPTGWPRPAHPRPTSPPSPTTPTTVPPAYSGPSAATHRSTAAVAPPPISCGAIDTGRSRCRPFAAAASGGSIGNVIAPLVAFSNWRQLLALLYM